MLANRVEQTSTTTGTGTYSLTGTVADRVTFVTGIGTAKQCYYLAVDNTNGGWEIGIGTVTDLATDTLSRDTIIGSSNGGLAVNWAAGTRNLMVVAAAELFGPMGGRLNKGAVGGTANAVTVANPVPLRALTDGAEICWDHPGDSSAAITVNPDSLGNTSLRDSAGGAFDATKILKSGQTIVARYKSSTGFFHVVSALQPVAAASDTFAGVIELAVQAEMETGTDVARAVTPGRQKFHGMHPKAWLNWDGAAGSILGDDGVTSVADDGVGLWTPTFDAAFSSATQYGFTHAHLDAANSTGQYIKAVNATKATTTIQHRANSNGAADDYTESYTAYWGDL